MRAETNRVLIRWGRTENSVWNEWYRFGHDQILGPYPVRRMRCSNRLVDLALDVSKQDVDEAFAELRRYVRGISDCGNDRLANNRQVECTWTTERLGGNQWYAIVPRL